MTKVHFYHFVNYEDGKLANLDLSEDEIPVNIFIDNAEELGDLPECDAEIDVYGVSGGVDVYKTEDEYYARGKNMAVQSMIPTGTFWVTDRTKQSRPEPTILYSGIVKSIDTDENAPEDRPNYLLEIETYGMTFSLYVRYDGEIQAGDIVSGSAWIYGDLKPLGGETV